MQLRSFVKEAAKTALVSIFVLSSSVSQNVPLCILCVACFAFLPGWFDVYYLDGVMMRLVRKQTLSGNVLHNILCV